MEQAAVEAGDVSFYPLAVQRLPDLSVPRGMHQTLVAGDEIIVLGGHTNGFRPLGTADPAGEQLSLFDPAPQKQAEDERDTRMQKTIYEIKQRFGANALLRGTNFQEGSTARERNATVGGHASGEGEGG